jgi:Tol biopolymer transport system component
MEKAPEQRFQSARDLGFALRNSSSSTGSLPALEASAEPASRRGVLTTVLLTLAALAVGIVLGMRAVDPEVPAPVRITTLTQSGVDSDPSPSPDGKMVAFVSKRDGVARVWLRQLDSGTEAVLTAGPDMSPNFSPDGGSILFLRNMNSSSALYRVPILGGEARKLIENVADVCWAPDSQRIAFLRQVGTVSEARVMVGVYDLRSGTTSELTTVAGISMYGVEWSPDGKWVSAVTASAINNSSVNYISVVNVETGEVHRSPNATERLSGAVWTANAKKLVIAQSTSILGDLAGAAGLVKLLDPFSGDERPLFWVQSVYAGSGDNVRFEFLRDDTLIFDEILWRGILDEVSLEGEPPYTVGTTLTRGNQRDRQPAYSPDGGSIVFSSNRNGNLDIWSYELATGSIRQITDDPAEDWDPAYTPDGRSIVWSSKRSGNLEIWRADIRGSGATVVTADGDDAENPTVTPDGKWLVYASGQLARAGIWKHELATGQEEHVADGQFFLPELSPDGVYVSYVVNDLERSRTVLMVSRLDDAAVVFETAIPFRGVQRTIQVGRTRWMPDGKSLVFVTTTETGKTALQIQDFVPGQDTTESRRPFVMFDSNEDIESFGISPDGKRLTVARFGHHRSLKIAEGLTDLN